MKRRTLLTALTGASVLASGCGSNRPNSDEPDAREQDRQQPTCGATTSLTVEPVSPGSLVETISVPRTGIGDADRTLRIPQLSERIERVLDGDPAIIEVERSPPLQPPPYVRTDGAVDTIDATVTNSESVSGPKYRVTEASYAEIRGEQLTQSTALTMPDLWRLTEGIRSRKSTLVAGFLDRDARDDSRLTEGAERLVVEFPDEIEIFGRYYLLERTGTATGTADRIRYFARRIGGPEAFTSHFVAEYGRSIEELRDDVRTLLEDAIEADGLEFCVEGVQTSDEEAYEAAMKRLKSRLRESDPLDGPLRHVFSLRHDSQHYVEYEGTWYYVEWVTGYA